MKNLLIALLLVISINALAQSFEGTIIWSIKTDMTPETKAQMEQMHDPARVAEMKKQMEDPQFKAMMEQNPQMKAQMEKMMAMMEDGGLNAVIPTGMIIKIRKQNMLTKMQGGFVTDEFLYLKNEDKSYALDRTSKTYTIEEPHEAGDDEPEVKVTRTNETARILNYTCTKYLVEMVEGPTKQTVWATTDIRDLDLSAMGRHQRSKKQSMYFKEIEGLPLKIEITSPQGNMTMQVTEIKRASLPAADFAIPADYREVKQDY